MTAAQIRLLASQLTEIGKNYRGFTCINEKMTKALVAALCDDLTERKEQAALLVRIAGKLCSEDQLALEKLANKLREQ